MQSISNVHRAFLIATASLFCSVAAAQQQESSGIIREGDSWVEKITASGPATGVTSLQARVRGKVEILGSNDYRLVVVYKKKVNARNIEEARRLLSMQQINVVRVQGQVVVSMVEPSWSPVTAVIEIDAPASLKQVLVATQYGDVEALGFRGAVRIESGGGWISADRMDGSLQCHTAAGDIRLGRVDGPVRCTTGGGVIRAARLGSEAWLDTGAGEVNVEYCAGPLHAGSAAGNVQVVRAGSTVEARTLGGEIRVLDAKGAVNADNAGGAIQISSARDVQLESVAGPIRLYGVSGQLRASTSLGNILAELFGGGLLDSFLSTAAGDITILIPSNLAVRIQAWNDAGMGPARVVSDFPEIRLVSGGKSGMTRLLASGDLNGGGPLLRVAAPGGTIFLRRQK